MAGASSHHHWRSSVFCAGQICPSGESERSSQVASLVSNSNLRSGLSGSPLLRRAASFESSFAGSAPEPLVQRQSQGERDGEKSTEPRKSHARQYTTPATGRGGYWMMMPRSSSSSPVRWKRLNTLRRYWIDVFTNCDSC